MSSKKKSQGWKWNGLNPGFDKLNIRINSLSDDYSETKKNDTSNERNSKVSNSKFDIMSEECGTQNSSDFSCKSLIILFMLIAIVNIRLL